MGKKRPVGVVLLAFFQVAFGLLMLYIFISLLPHRNDPVYFGDAIYLFPAGTAAVLLGIGLFFLWSWARVTVITFSWAFLAVFSVFFTELFLSNAAIFYVPLAGHSILCIIYLTRPVVRESFRGTGTELSLFFSREEKQRIVSAIREAETKTSAEIRVYLERKAKEDLMERARKVFEKLGMTRTEKRNGVLIYFSLVNHQFTVLGDRGIHEKVGDDFWKDVVSLMQGHFSRGEFVEGLEAGISRVGEKLKIYFPRELGDINELPDEVQG